ncbi:hypothetical protein BASA_1372, partial [Bifidobacterium animalis subsp. animalis]
PHPENHKPTPNQHTTKPLRKHSPPPACRKPAKTPTNGQNSLTPIPPPDRNKRHKRRHKKTYGTFHFCLHHIRP